MAFAQALSCNAKILLPAVAIGPSSLQLRIFRAKDLNSWDFTPCSSRRKIDHFLSEQCRGVQTRRYGASKKYGKYLPESMALMFSALNCCEASRAAFLTLCSGLVLAELTGEGVSSISPRSSASGSGVPAGSFLLASDSLAACRVVCGNVFCCAQRLLGKSPLPAGPVAFRAFAVERCCRKDSSSEASSWASDPAIDSSSSSSSSSEASSSDAEATVDVSSQEVSYSKTGAFPLLRELGKVYAVSRLF